MTESELQAKLDELCALPHETEWVEFKHNKADPKEIREYMSALSNVAALHRQPFAYIVWGIEDGTHKIVGTSFKPRSSKAKGNEDLEPWLARGLNPRINFTIHEFARDTISIILFRIQAANSQPAAFLGQKFIRVGSHKKSLTEYPEKERELWHCLSARNEDWSSQICIGATIEDLDPKAIAFAKQIQRQASETCR